jgi:hypothetical protein
LTRESLTIANARKECAMGFGTGIFLLAAGAILVFAVRVNVWWVDLDAVGLVLMGSGAAVLAVTAWFWHDHRPWWRSTFVEERPAQPPVYPPPPDRPSAPPPAD